MPRPHQAGGTRRRHRQIKLPRGDPSVVKQGISATRLRRAQQTPLPVVKEDLLPPRTPCKAPVTGATESASAQTLQGPDVSSFEESISDSPQTVPHKTIGASSSTFPSSCQKLVAGAADFTYALTLQESDVSSLDEFLDNSSEQKVVEGAVSSLEELLDTASSEESITANPRTVPHNTIDGLSRTFPSRFGKLVTGAAESTSALTLQEPDVSYSDEFCDSSSEESFTTSPRMVPHSTIDSSPPPASSLGSNILIWRPPCCFEVFYIRIDQRGFFWIYPNLGGPFQSIDETDYAINSFLDVLQCEARTGTTKENTYSEKWYLVQAILDQFNDENNLSGNLAYQLEDLLRKQLIYEKLRWYYHFNFTTKQKEVDDNPITGKKLFFAEVSHMQGKKEWEVNCCRMIESEAKGGHCFGCKNNGSPDMQHPNETDAYTGGHLDGYLPFGCYDLSSSDDDQQQEEEEEDDNDDDDDEEEDEEEEED